ncbi:hypothetical protein EDB81DRAFT_754175 [Dactylonectria macrodidyma]|uniref:F-box domain-containing protein n=1 Tax=Dactylonectria macrodidyma TaxID=307937 RepID=A0A9P9JFM3_9HYPO|nr:hypothetical protein EDB81DRAFT_754175 [Dactylonectria macrodidyma]
MEYSSAPTALYRFSMELTSLISSFLSLQSLHAISRVSKACRFLFARHLFEGVRLQGHPKLLAQQLHAFHLSQTNAPQVDVRDHVRQAIIGLTVNLSRSHPQSQDVKWSTSRRVYRALPTNILKSIQLMSNLRRLALDIEFLTSKQTRRLVNALNSAETFRIRHLKIAGKGQFVPVFIKHCCPCTLIDLTIITDTQSAGYIAAVETLQRTHKASSRL